MSGSPLAAAMATAAATHVRELAAVPSSTVIGIVQPAGIVAVVVLAGAPGSADLADAACAGLLSVWAATVWSSGLMLRREVVLGTIVGILTRPTSLLAVVAAKTAGAAVATVVTVAGTVAAVVALAGVPVSVASPAVVLLAAVLAVASSWALALLLGFCFLLTRSAPRIAEALLYPVFLAGGILIPVDLLPTWLGWASTVVALRWVAELLRSGISGDGVAWAAAAAAAGLGAVYLAGAVASYRAVLDRIRREGTVGVV